VTLGAVVVDTNVAVAASGRAGQVGAACVLACIDALRDIQKDGIVVIDNAWRILSEYTQNLSASGQPGAGDYFLMWVLQNQANPLRCEQVAITPLTGPSEDYAEFPDAEDLRSFDPSDRKFVAVALASAHAPAILNATDTDWYLYALSLVRSGVHLEFLCPEVDPG